MTYTDIQLEILKDLDKEILDKEKSILPYLRNEALEKIMNKKRLADKLQDEHGLIMYYALTPLNGRLFIEDSDKDKIIKTIEKAGKKLGITVKKESTYKGQLATECKMLDGYWFELEYENSYNNLIKSFTKDSSRVFIIKTSNNPEYWCWEVDKSYVEEYNGTEEEFVNDLDNSCIGCSTCGWNTLEEVLKEM